MSSPRVCFITISLLITVSVSQHHGSPAYYETSYQNDCVYQTMPEPVVNKLLASMELSLKLLDNLLAASNVSSGNLERLLGISNDTQKDLGLLISKDRLHGDGTQRIDSQLLLHLLEKFEEEQNRLWEELSLIKTSLDRNNCSLTGTCENVTQVLWTTLLRLQEDFRNLQIKVHTLPDKGHCISTPDWPKDCGEIAKLGKTESGVFTIYPYKCERTKGVKVWCDLEDGDGWTVVLSRKPLREQVDFGRKWEDYKTGFGNPQTEYWIGNDALHALTSNSRQTLHIDMEDWDGEKRYVEYNIFIVEGEDKNYRLHVGGYSGNAGDALKYHDNMAFTTVDSDNDHHELNCAVLFGGGFWFNQCHRVSATNPLLGKQQNTKGINWSRWHTDRTTLKEIYFKVKDYSCF